MIDNKILVAEFKLRDLVLLGIIGCSLLGVVVSLILLIIPSQHDFGEMTLTISQTIGEWTGLVLLVLSGTTIKTKYWRFIVACASIVFMSWLFRILHLPGATALLFAGFILLEIVYTIRFITRSPTGILDWLKYLWVCSWCFLTFAVRFDKLPLVYEIIPAILFWITIVMFIVFKMKMVKEVKTDC